MRNVLLLSLVGVFSMACSQALVIEPPRAVVADNDGLECKRGTPTGTIRTHTRCTTTKEREEDRKAAEVGMEQREKEERELQETIRQQTIQERQSIIRSQ